MRGEGAELGLVRAIGDALAGAHSRERIAGVVVETLARQLRVDRVVVWHFGAMDRRLRVLAATTDLAESPPMAEGLVAEVARRGEPLLLADRVGVAANAVPHELRPCNAVVLQPLRVHGGTIGVIGVGAGGMTGIDAEAAAAIALVAPSIAMALENGRLRTLASLADRADLDAEREGPRTTAVDFRQARESAVGGTERALIERALVATRNNRTQAARLLGIGRRTLLYKLKRYGIAAHV